VARGYGGFLAWLQSVGALDPDAGPTGRATRERLRQYVEALQARGLANRSLGNAVQALANALQAMAPDGDWSYIQRASSRLHARAVAVVDINAKMRPREEIYQFGLDLMAAADHDRFRNGWERAVLYRDGLLLALLVLRPLRVSNAAQIRIGRQLHRRGEAWWLSFDATEMKSARPFECPWPDALAVALDRYIETHRPRITEGAASRGGPATPSGCRATARR
jgi:integrase/recombinase XerD